MINKRFYKVKKKLYSKKYELLISLFIAALIYYYFYDNKDFYYLFFTRNLFWARTCIPKDRVIHNPNPNIGIIMSYESNYGKLGYLSELDKRYYASVNNYTLLVNREVLNPTRKPSWNKVLMAIRHLEDFDWLLYVDADTLIMNPEIKLHDLIDDKYDMLIAEDHRGLNAGVWIIKNTYWSQIFLRKWYFEGESFVQDASSPFGKSGDQDTLNHFIMDYPEGDIKDHIKIMPQCAFNSFPYYRGNYEGVYMKGDFLLHFASKGSIEDRELLFRMFMNNDYYTKIKDMN